MMSKETVENLLFQKDGRSYLATVSVDEAKYQRMIQRLLMRALRNSGRTAAVADGAIRVSVREVWGDDES